MTRSSAGSRTSTRRSTARSEALANEVPIPLARRRLMARVRQRHTGAERIVRSVLHALGFRFTVDGPLNRSLPSRPDIVLPRWKTVVLVHGCFWHRHPGCRLATLPKSRIDFWNTKFAANVARDARQRRRLRAMGWRVITVWECETRNPVKLSSRLRLEFRESAASRSRRTPNGPGDRSPTPGRR